MSRVAFTVDVEQDVPPYLQSWRGLEQGLPLLLSLLDAHGIEATLFVTGDAASRFPGAIATAAATHEIGCHGLDHMRFDRMPPEEQRRQITAATAILRRVTGRAPAGFRAPNFQYSTETLRLVQQAGYTYDASRARYHYGPGCQGTGLQQAVNTFPSSLLRLPWRLAGPPILAALRLLPLVVLDFHPWELVPISGLRPDITYATGPKAVERLDTLFSRLKSRGVHFVTLETALQQSAPAKLQR